MKHLSLALALLFSCTLVLAQDKKPDAKAPTTPAGYAVGSVVADFTLNDLDGKKTSLKSLGEGKKFIVVDFWSRECPAAKGSEAAFGKLEKDFGAKGVALVHIA